MTVTTGAKVIDLASEINCQNKLWKYCKEAASKTEKQHLFPLVTLLILQLKTNKNDCSN